MGRYFYILMFILLASNFCFAQSSLIDKQVIQWSNEVMSNIYWDIQAQKEKYKELENFGEENLRQMSDGIYFLTYEDFGLSKVTNEKSYGFNIRLVPLSNKQKIKSNESKARYDFPVLGVSLQVDQFRALKTKQLNIMPIVNRQQQLLADKQQERLPFRLSIKTTKESFIEDENIEFIVSLKNTTNYDLKVQNLSSRTLQFTVDGSPWRITESEAVNSGRSDYIILKGGDSVSKKFQGKGLANLNEFNVLCSYSMAYQGVNPLAVLRIQILRSIPPMKL